MLVCRGTLAGRPVNVGLAHCPSSDQYPWKNTHRYATLPVILKELGAQRMLTGSDYAEPQVPWILGGGLNCRNYFLSNFLQDWRPSDKNEIQHVRAHTLGIWTSQATCAPRRMESCSRFLCAFSRHVPSPI